MVRFEGLTVFIMATNEQVLLKKTVYSVIKYCGAEHIFEIIVILPSSDCLAAAAVQELMRETTDVRIRTYLQKNKNKILFFAEIPFLARSSHFVIMVADMEMDPATLTEMLDIAIKKPEGIVCGARWLKESDVQGYGYLRRSANILVNRIASRIIGADCRDLFSVYQIYPKTVFDAMRFRRDKTLLYEYTLKPVSRGVEYVEIPTHSRRRTEGKTNTNILLLSEIAISFLVSAIRVRLKND